MSDYLPTLFADWAPIGARGGLLNFPGGPFAWDPNMDAAVARCSYCRVRIIIPRQLALMEKGDALSAIKEIFSHHWHVTPRLLTAEERERIRILGVHRRGINRAALSGGR